MVEEEEEDEAEEEEEEKEEGKQSFSLMLPFIMPILVLRRRNIQRPQSR